MRVTCEKCALNYDDAVCSTICPHDRFLTPEQARRKDMAIEMLGKRVRVKGASGQSYRIASVGWDGMVWTEGNPSVEIDPKELEVE